MSSGEESVALEHIDSMLFPTDSSSGSCGIMKFNVKIYLFTGSNIKATIFVCVNVIR